MLDILAEIPDLYDTLHVTIWRHAIAWALEQMEDEHDGETLETLSDDTFDDLLNEYPSLTKILGIRPPTPWTCTPRTWPA